MMEQYKNMLDIQQVGHARGHLQRILSTLSVFLPLSSRAYILSIQIVSTLHSRGPIYTLYSRDPIF